MILRETERNEVHQLLNIVEALSWFIHPELALALSMLRKVAWQRPWLPCGGLARIEAGLSLLHSSGGKEKQQGERAVL